MFPIVLSTKASFEIHEEKDRINQHLTNVFQGTTNEKVLGDIDLLIEKPKKKEKDKEKDKEKEKESKKKKNDNSQTCLVNKIMQDTSFKLKKKDGSVKKQKTTKVEKSNSLNNFQSGSQRQNILIESPLEIPVFRYVPSRMIMQRIITRYFNLLTKVRDETGTLITYENGLANSRSLFPPVRIAKEE